MRPRATTPAIGAALEATGGVGDTEAFRTAMLKADFASTRGAFTFGPNQHPVQDWYAMKVEKDAGGNLVLKTERKILSSYVDPFGSQCTL